MVERQEPPATGSLAWLHFTKQDNGASCNYCKKFIPIKGCNTSGMIRHLPQHKEQHNEYLKQKKDREDKKQKDAEERKRKSGQEDIRSMKQPKLSFSKPTGAEKEIQLKFNDSLLEYVANYGVSFRQAAGLKDVIAIANIRIKVPSSWTLARSSDNKGRSVLKQVTKIIAAVRASEELVSIGFTTDLWTSRSGDSYISLTTSFIDHMWRMHHWTPFVRYFPGSHTGERIAVTLDSMIEELNLDSEAISKYSVNDNAANQKKAIRDSKYLVEYNCDIHTVQLGINDTFKQVEGMKSVLDKSKAIAKYTNQSPLANNELKAECKAKSLEFKKPKNSQETRWNSSYTCMESILFLKPALKNLMEKDSKWEQFSLNYREWKLLEGAVKLLKPFMIATKLLEAEKTPTINLVIERILTLEDGLKSFISNRNNCQYGVTFAKALFKNLQKRFPNSGGDIFERKVANYLDPRYKGIHLSVIGELEQTKLEMNEKFGDAEESGQTAQASGNESPNLELSPTSRLLKQARSRRMEESPNNKLKAEMTKYESFSLSHKQGSILFWWKTHSSLLPILSKIARRILAIPSSSAKSERVFSTGGNMVTVKRGSLGPARVEHLIFIKENLSKIREFEMFMCDYEIAEASEENGFEKIDIFAERLNRDTLDGDVESVEDFGVEDLEVEDLEDDFLDDDDAVVDLL